MSLSIFLVFCYVCASVAIAFFTLLERKVLGYFQVRKGPSKVGVLGVLQPLSDVVKLLSKTLVRPTASRVSLLLVSPVLGLFTSFICFSFYPVRFPAFVSEFTFMVFLCVSRVSVYPIFMGGWRSNSKYSLLGRVRAVAQRISYEVSIGIIVVAGAILCEKIELSSVYIKNFFILGFFFPLLIGWFVRCLAETGRAPLDFMEGESEIVSGFNIEYGSGLFSFILIAEYINIIFIRAITRVIFLGFRRIWAFSSCTVLIILSFVWVRGSFPRVRYDKLIDLT